MPTPACATSFRPSTYNSGVHLGSAFGGVKPAQAGVIAQRRALTRHAFSSQRGPAPRRSLGSIASLNSDAHGSPDASGNGPAPVKPSLTGQPLLWAVVPAFLPILAWGGGGAGKGGNGGGGGGGGGGGASAQEVLALAADDDDSDDEEEEEEEEEEYEEGAEEGTYADDEESTSQVASDGSFVCGELVAKGLPTGEGIPTEAELFAGLACQPGFACSRAELASDIKALYDSGFFSRVNAKVLPLSKGRFRVEFEFEEKAYPPLSHFEVEGAKVLPRQLVKDLRAELLAEGEAPFTMQTMARIRNAIEGWYRTRGYGLCYISQFTGMDNGSITVHVNEGRTSKLNVVWITADGQPAKVPGKVDPAFILKHCPVEKGRLYNLADGRKTLQNVFALDLFDNVQILPRQNERDPTRVEVDVMVKEKPLQTADIEAEWGLAADANNRPTPVSFIPGGTITYENRNLGGKAATLAASINTKSFWAPAEDISYRLSYQRPFFYGLNDPHRTKLQATAFNARKVCGVFTPGPDGEEVPPVWVDRAGARVGLTQQFSRGSRGSLALVAQEVGTRDESGAPCARGGHVASNGAVVADGPPTTLGEAGRDRLAYAQASLIRDTTYLQDGAQLGARDIFTVDQGLGIGTGNPFFNRCTAECTRFLPLSRRGVGGRLGPATLVLHAKAGAALGDLPAYDAFLLGGPYSVRGYNIGELAACRRFAEGAAEVRVPVLGRTLYAFAEAGSDLGSSKEVRGNPSAYFRRAGRGTSAGAGVKLGALRVEGVRDNNAGRWHVMLHYGERF